MYGEEQPFFRREQLEKSPQVALFTFKNIFDALVNVARLAYDVESLKSNFL